MAFSTFSSGIRFRDRNLRRGKNGGKRFFLFFLSIIRRKEKGDPAFRNFRAITGDDYFRSSRIIKRHSPQPDFSKAAWKKNACPFSIVNRRAVTTRPFLFLEPCDFALVISKLLIGNKFDTIFLSRPISFIPFPGNANWINFFLRKNTYIFIIYTLPSYFIFFSFIKFVSIREIILKQARVDFFDFPFILKRNETKIFQSRTCPSPGLYRKFVRRRKILNRRKKKRRTPRFHFTRWIMENRDTFEFGFTDSSDRIEKSISPREKRIERKVEMVVEFEGEGRGGEGRQNKRGANDRCAVFAPGKRDRRDRGSVVSGAVIAIKYGGVRGESLFKNIGREMTILRDRSRDRKIDTIN